VSEGNAGRVSWEDVGVINLARDPSLHERDVLMSWDFDGLLARVQPGE